MPVPKIIVIGASAGGVEALTKLVSGLPTDLSVALFVVLHISSHGTSILPRILSRAGLLEAIHPKHDEVIQPGHIYIAPPDHHLLVKRGHIHLGRGSKENGHRPAIDPLFRTAARAYGSRVIGIVLSGALDDGTAGLLAVKMQGGITIVQNPDDALYPDMPRSAIENVQVDYILPVSEIAAILVRLAHEPLQEEELAPVSNDLQIESDLAELDPAALHKSDRPGTPSPFACPDCGGVLWELNEGNLLRFRCRTGHAFSVESLLSQQSNALEEALWSAMRALEENAALTRRIAERARKRNQHTIVKRYEEKEQLAHQRAEVIRQVLLNNLSDIGSKANE